MEYNFMDKNIRKNSTTILISIFIALLIGILSSVLNPFLVFVPVIGFLLIFMLFKRPKLYFFFMFGFIILFPKVSIINVQYTYVGIRSEDFLTLLATIFLIIFFLMKRKKNFIKIDKKIMKILLSYITVCILSIIYGIVMNYIEYPLAAFMVLFRKIEYFIFIIFGYLVIHDEKDNKTIIKIIDFTLIPILTIGLLQSKGILGAFRLGKYVSNCATRIVSVFSDPWEYSAYLVLITPIYLTRLISKKCKLINKIYSLVIICVVTYSLFLTQARISIIAFTILILFYAIKNKKVGLSIFLIVFGVLTSIIFNGTEILPERFSTINLNNMYTSTKIAFKYADYHNFLNNGYYVHGGYKGDLSFNIRISKWADLLDGVIKNPLFGLGLSTTTEAVDGNYVRYLAESGIIGFAIWILLIISVIKRSKNVLKSTTEWNTLLLGRTLYFGIFSLLIMAVFIDIFEASKISMFLWMIVGINLRNIELI